MSQTSPQLKIIFWEFDAFRGKAISRIMTKKVEAR